MTQLARDIKERGQLEPIILYKGVILNGRNRYRACQIAGVKPRIEEFDAKATRRSPEEFILSRNLRRRHLSVGQKAAIALELAAFREVIERLKPDDEIRALHTRAVANGGNWCLLSVGNFGHVVVCGAEKDRTLAKVKDTLAGPSAPQRF